MANFLPPAIIEIKALADKAISELKEVNKELEKMEGAGGKASAGIGNMEKASKLATGALLGLGAAFAGFAAIGVKEAMEAETALNKLGATMSAVGVNTAANREQIKTLTDSYVDLGFSGDSAALGFENLLRVTGDIDESQKLLALSADLARTKNIGLTEAAGILAKASQGNAKAFKEMGITLDTTLPKSEAVAKAMDELNGKIGTQAENATKTFAVQLQIVKERFNDTAESLGAALLPLIKETLDKINEGVEFIKKHSEAFKILGGIIITVGVALASYNAAVKIQMALTKAWSIITGIQVAVTKLLTGQQLALNGAMKLNPIGLVVSAAMLLVGAFVMLWNKSETFRKGVIQVGKVALTAFASIIPTLGDVAEAILKFVLTPLKTMLTVLSKLPGVGKFAKAGLDILNKGLDGVSDFADKAAAKAKSLAANLDKLNKPIKIGGGKGLEIPELENTGKGAKGKGGLTAEEKKAIKEKNDQIKKATEEADEILGKMNKIYADQAKDLAKVAAKRDAEIEEAYMRHNDTVVKLQDQYNERMSKAQETYNEKVADANAAYYKAEIAARSAYAKTIADIESDYASKTMDIQADYQKQISDLQGNAANARIEAQKSAAEKEKSIMQQSIDRLRNAFASGLKFDLKVGFEKGGVEGIIDDFKKKLQAAKQLQENAAKLAGAGYSQTFIEQIVANGPEMGNQMAEALLKANPETQAELKQLFLDSENVSENGLNSLAETMNAGGNLATKQLRDAYKQVAVDLKDALQKIDSDLQRGLTEANQSYMRRMQEAAEERMRRMAEAQEKLNEALKEAQDRLNEALAEADKNLKDAQGDAKKTLDEGLADAAKTLAERLEETQKNYETAVTEILESTKEKIAELKIKLVEVANLLVELGARQAAANAMAASIAAQEAANAAAAAALANGSSGTQGSTTGNTNTNTNINVTNNVSGSLDVDAMNNSLLGVIRYGLAIRAK